jgi:hypothetical protein
MMCSLLDRRPEKVTQFVDFISQQIFSPLIGADAEDTRSITFLEALLNKMLPWLNGLPKEATEQHKSLRVFQHQLLGIAYLVGETPFSHNSSIDHVWSLEKEDTAISRAAQSHKSFVSKLLNGAWMLHSGESAHWPAVEEAITKLEFTDPDANQDARHTPLHTRCTHATHAAQCTHSARTLHTHCTHAARTLLARTLPARTNARTASTAL